MASARVCLVTPGYISSSPRVVREADALAAAGYDVRVAFTQGALVDVRAFDDALIENRPWRTSVFRWSAGPAAERWAHYRSGARHHLARMLADRGVLRAGVVARAEGRIYPELAHLAAAEPADLYIGHYPVGLAAAAVAAARHGAALGYDLEDLYADTFAATPAWLHSRRRIIAIERQHAASCQYLTAVSDPVADVFAERYHTARPQPIYNCHPWGARQRLDGQIKERRGAALSLFWFSQTVGLDRGLQTAIEAAALARHPVQIHLRGACDEGTRRSLIELARARGVEAALHFHPRCAPDELLSRAAEHDAGLALETDAALNRMLAVTNKIFLYFTAGTAVLATDLPGQRRVMETAPAAGLLHAQGDAAAIAAQLDAWSAAPARLAAAKAAALDAARTRWNAEHEAACIVSSVARVVDPCLPRRAASGE
jgi:glycosyltransferase involved in cell wall biosynthesis